MDILQSFQNLLHLSRLLLKTSEVFFTSVWHCNLQKITVLNSHFCNCCPNEWKYQYCPLLSACVCFFFCGNVKETFVILCMSPIKHIQNPKLNKSDDILEPSCKAGRFDLILLFFCPFFISRMLFVIDKLLFSTFLSVLLKTKDFWL